MSDTNNMSNATLIKWNDAKPNAEFLRIRSDGSFEIQGGAPTLFVLGQLVHAFLKQQERIKRLEEAGDELTESSHSADDDIREHLQVANYNLHGLLNTGERITPPNPPKTVHQAGIDASVRVRERLRAARLAWKAAKEAKP